MQNGCLLKNINISWGPDRRLDESKTSWRERWTTGPWVWLEGPQGETERREGTGRDRRVFVGGTGGQTGGCSEATRARRGKHRWRGREADKNNATPTMVTAGVAEFTHHLTLVSWFKIAVLRPRIFLSNFKSLSCVATRYFRYWTISTAKDYSGGEVMSLFVALLSGWMCKTEGQQYRPTPSWQLKKLRINFTWAVLKHKLWRDKNLRKNNINN